MNNEDTVVVPYKDKRRFLWIIAPLLPILAAIYLWIGYVTGVGIFYWIFPVGIYVIMPIADKIIGIDCSGPAAAEIADLDQDPYYRRLVYLFAPGQILLTYAGMWLCVTRALGVDEILGVGLTVGMVNGVGFIPAHELTHRNNLLSRWLAKLMLAPMAYGHFFSEHVRGHHKNVATYSDPTSSRMGESFWVYLPRAVVTGVQSAWRIEEVRLARNGFSKWTFRNENLHCWAMTVALFGPPIAFGGWRGLMFFMVQAAFSVVLLEVTNYIEHYGLLRHMLPNGHLERCTPSHSWVSNHIFCSLFLYQLQRHADHHTNPARRFQSLCHFSTSPQLPASYVTMMLVAYIPPLWFRIMDPLLIKYYSSDVEKINVMKNKRSKIFRRYGAIES